MSSECSGETAPSVLVNDLMCWLIRLQKPVHSRFFEACADREGGAGGVQKGGGQRGSNSGNIFSC